MFLRYLKNIFPHIVPETLSIYLSILHYECALTPTPFTVSTAFVFFPGAVRSSAPEGPVWLPKDEDSLRDQPAVSSCELPFCPAAVVGSHQVPCRV